jgi:hypothetical protein
MAAGVTDRLWSVEIRLPSGKPTNEAYEQGRTERAA